jgi:hypothetical protein
MLELEKRGKLPTEKAVILGKLRERGVVPKNDTGVQSQPGFFQPGGKFNQFLDARPLTTVGAIGGGIIGAGAGAPTGPGAVLTSAAGAGVLGSAGGATERYLKQSLGYAPRETLGQSTYNTLDDFLTNSVMDMGGGVAAKAIGATLKGAGNAAKFVNNLVPGGLSNFVREGIENLNPAGVLPIGPAIKKMRIAKEAAAKTAFNVAEDARRSAFQQTKTDVAMDFNLQESQRKADFLVKKAEAQAAKLAAQQQAKEGIKLLPQKMGAQPRVAAGQDLVSSAKSAELAFNENVGAVLNPIINKNSGAKVSVEPVRQQIFSILNDAGLTDVKGNILEKAIGKVRAPELKSFYTRLSLISKDLVENPTLITLNRKLKELGSLANFGVLSRSGENKAFGSVYNIARNNLNDALEVIASPEEAALVKSVKKSFSENKPIFEFFESLGEKTSEQIVDSARNVFSGSKISEIITKQPALRKPIQDVVLNDLARSSSSATSFGGALDKYGRESLQNLFGKDVWGDIVKAEQNIVRASKPMKAQVFQPGIAPQVKPFEPGQFNLKPYAQKTLDQVNSGAFLGSEPLKILIKAIGITANNN